MPLLFLMKLQHVRLPIRITYPEEMRHVTVLLATGLIEATIVAVQGASAKYNTSPLVATVHRITNEGYKEIAGMGNLSAFVGASLTHARRLHLI